MIMLFLNTNGKFANRKKCLGITVHNGFSSSLSQNYCRLVKYANAFKVYIGSQDVLKSTYFEV